MAALRIFTRSKVSTVIHGFTPVEPLKNVSPFVLGIQKRWSNYRSSPMYKDPSHYTDFEVSRDPKEWMYVERLLRYKQIPEPKKDTDLPSGYKPARASPSDYPYFVPRTRNFMQPVYLTITQRGLRKITKVRKIQGDIWSMTAELKKYLEKKANKEVGIQMNEFVGEIKLRGDYVSYVKQWLDMKGF